MIQHKSTTALLIGALIAAAAATAADDRKPNLSLEDQPLGNEVMISSLTLDQPGFVVIHKDDGGKPGPVIGHSELIAAGTHEQVMVPFDTSQAGVRVFPMLHHDNGDGQYEFPGPDGPVSVDGKVLVGAVNWQ